jgi:hypothetical protein
VHGVDYPDDPVEAAVWLVAKYGATKADPEAAITEVEGLFAEAPEAIEPPRTYDEATAEYFAEHPEDETHGEAGAEAQPEQDDLGVSGAAGNDVRDAERRGDDIEPRGFDAAGGDGGFETDTIDAEWDAEPAQSAGAYDAEFYEPDREAIEAEPELDPPLLEGAELGPDIVAAEDEAEITPPQDRFYGLDDLDRRKTVAIGLVIRRAAALMPPFSIEDEACLKEYRNFAMGVSEDRWPNDQAIQAELKRLEDIVSQQAAIAGARDAKVAAIEAADREAFEALDLEANWPLF